METNEKPRRPTGQQRELTAKGRQVGKAYLVNRLNYINFQDGTILINFEHPIYNSVVSLKAAPLPCLGDALECVWVHDGNQGLPTSSYELKNIMVPSGRKLLMVEPDSASIDEKGMRFLIPDVCIDVSSRMARRDFCKGIEVRLNQNSAVFHGQLIDFSSVTFRVEVNAIPPQTFEWIDPASPVDVMFSESGETLFAGECRILRQSDGSKTRCYVAEPLVHHIRRFKPKEFRNTRQKLVPSPDVTFIHPFTRRICSLKVIDIAGLGFSVEEDKDNAVLLPGMIIPEVELSFANSFKVACKVQVVYRTVSNGPENGNRLKCGMVIMDIGTGDHGKLLSLLYQAKDSHSYLGSKVDLDDLWEFFFETGFIYPKKYEFLRENREKIKDTYRKLYTLNPEILRHFIYQDKGRIMGHMAMIRFYEKSWLIQHHAADSRSTRAGLRVLYQVGRFINDSHGLYSTKMHFVFCYYRPENRFPSRVFGGAARSIEDPRGCSLDTFSYFHIRKQTVQETALSQPWRLMKTGPQDLFELKHFYESDSGGLMLNALEIDPDSGDISELSAAYKKLGLKRERYFFSLKHEESLKAVFMVDISDIGLNLSEATNSIKVIIVDSDGLTKDVLYSAFSGPFEKFESSDIPILLYPATYADKAEISCEKSYNLWILNMQYTDQYFNYIQWYFKGDPC